MNSPTTQAPLVSLSQVHKKFPRVHALQGIDLNIAPGEVLGLFGHNGAGKSTMMKLILGLFAPTSGDIQVLGANPTADSAAVIRRQVGYLPENVSFYDQLSGLEVLRYFARLKNIELSKVDALLDEVGLAHAAKRKVKTYSKGMRQRLGLAQAMLGNPKLLLLDEPTVGLDPIATAEFYQSVDQLKQGGCAVILCSHVLPGVEQHVDRVMIMAGGKSLALGTIDNLRQQAQLPIIIKSQGIERQQLLDHGYAGMLHNGVDGSLNQVLQVSPAQQLEVLRTLSNDPQLQHLELNHPSLEKLYLHFQQLHHGGAA